MTALLSNNEFYIPVFHFSLDTWLSQASPWWVAPSDHPCPHPKPVEILGKFPEAAVDAF